jgi:hypothetical protein
MSHADEQKRTLVFFWEWSGAKLTTYVRSEWNPHDPADIKFALEVIGGDVPLEGWISLAEDFVTSLDS